MSIDELVAVVKPPAQPLEAGPVECWNEIQEKLGTKLPDDLRDFGLTYGTGSFSKLGIRVFNPFAAVFLQWIEEEVGAWRDLKAAEGEEEIPFGVFPESPGLLPWGKDNNGNGLFWLAEGNPEQWPIIVRGEPPKYARFELPLTSFLAQAFTGALVPKVIWSRVFKKGTKQKFEPEKIELRDKSHQRTVYQLYMDNGMRAGFWIQHFTWDGLDAAAQVRSVNGQTEGPLKEKPPKYGDGPVTIDYYRDKKPIAKDHVLGNAGDPNFRIVEKPDWCMGY